MVEAATRDRLIVLNAPDNLRGVPVFHNGLPEALEYFQNQMRFKQIEVVAFQALGSAEDETTATHRAGSSGLQLSNRHNDFVRVEPSTCVETVAQTKRSIELSLRPCAADADLFLFDKGKMIRLPER